MIAHKSQILVGQKGKPFEYAEPALHDSQAHGGGSLADGVDHLKSYWQLDAPETTFDLTDITVHIELFGARFHKDPTVAQTVSSMPSSQLRASLSGAVEQFWAQFQTYLTGNGIF